MFVNYKGLRNFFEDLCFAERMVTTPPPTHTKKKRKCSIKVEFKELI